MNLLQSIQLEGEQRTMLIPVFVLAKKSDESKLHLPERRSQLIHSANLNPNRLGLQRGRLEDARATARGTEGGATKLQDRTKPISGVSVLVLAHGEPGCRASCGPEPRIRLEEVRGGGS